MTRLKERSAFHAAMSVHARLMRSLWLAVIVGALVALAAHQWVARDGLNKGLLQAGLEHAQVIDAALDKVGANAPRRDQLLQAQFDVLRLRRIELLDGNDDTAFRRVAGRQDSSARSAIERLLKPPAPVAEWLVQSKLGLSGPVRLRVEAADGDVMEQHWQTTIQFALWLAGFTVVLLLVGSWSLRNLRRQVFEVGLRSTLPTERRSRSDSRQSTPQTAPQPVAPTDPKPVPLVVPPRFFLDELARLEIKLAAQSEELESLRRKAHVDALTGLPARGQVMARIEEVLDGADAWPAAALLLVRVRDLTGLNRRVGHDTANGILRAMAAGVQAVADQNMGAVLGRLNGSDFVLLLPRKGIARATASQLLASLRQALITIDPAAGLAVGAVDLQGRVESRQAMALADEALANAEADALFAFSATSNTAEQPAFGDSVWQFRLADALANRRTVLAGFPVCARDGRVLYLDCPLRVQFEPDGPYESAWRWLALATRGRLSADIDLRVVQMALEAIVNDGQSRCINVAAQSLASSEFMQGVTDLLEALPDAARRLWIDLPEVLALDRPGLVREATRRWRPLGVKVALEHAGENLGRIEQLHTLGLDCVRIDGRFLRGLTGADSGNVRRHLLGMVKLVHDANLIIAAEGLSAAGDLSLVWAMGFDAATGPAVLKRNYSTLPQ